MENIKSDKTKSAGILPEILNGIYINSPSAILLLNCDGNIIGCNRSAENHFGYVEKEILGFFNPVILPESRYEYLSMLNEIKNGRKIECKEVTRQNKNGEKIKLFVNSFPIAGASGNIETIAEFYSKSSNISETHFNIKTFEDFYISSSSRTDNLLFSLDNHLNLSFVSVNAKNYITDEQYNEVINSNLAKAMEIVEIPLNKIEQLTNLVHSAIKEKQTELSETIDLTINKKDINFNVNAKLYFTESGEFTGIRGIMKDNTVIKDLQYEISDKIHRINFLTQNLDNIIFYTILENNISIFKKNIFGYSREKFTSHPKLMKGIVYYEDIEEYDSKYEKWLNTGMKDVLDLEYRIKDSEGNIIWIEEHIIHDNDIKGKNRLTGLIININERKENEIKLKETKNDIERANLMKSALLRNLSHELRTPITSILGLSEIISEETNDENLKAKTLLISRAGNKLLYIIKSIINLALLEESKFDFKQEKANIREIIEKLLDNYIKETECKTINLNCSSGEEYYAIIDVRFLQTIFLNILDSIIYQNGNGNEGINVEILNDKEHKYCEIKITYTGEDLVNQDYHNISRVNAENNGGYNSRYYCSDIGLMVAQKMTELFKGTFEVRRKNGNKSAFILRFPAEFGLAVEKVENEPSEIKEKKLLPDILIVEDNLINKIITTTFLRGVCNIDHAPDGKTALKLIDKNPYDLILMDINLGTGINGIETTKLIREKENYKNVPVIAVTGYAMPGDERRLLHLGFNSYISKPFRKDQLISVVKSSLIVSESTQIKPERSVSEINNIINSFSYTFFTVNLDFKIQYINETARRRIRNIHSGEQIRKDTDFFEYVADKSEIENIFENVSRGVSVSTKNNIVNFGDEFVPDLEIYNPIFNELNDITGFSYTGICMEKTHAEERDIEEPPKEIIDKDVTVDAKPDYNIENLTTALELANIGIWAWDSEKDKYYWSEKFFQMMGISDADENFGVSDFAAYIYPDDLKKVLNAIKKCVTDNSPVNLEFRYLKNKKTLSYCRLTAKYLKNNGSSGKLISIITDITRIKEYELKLEKKTKELEHINLRKDKFLSMVAHDLRSPFTGLLGLAEILSINSDTLSKEDVKEISNQIHQSSKQIFNLLENLLEWSRIQRGKINYVKVDLQLKNLVDKIINLYHHNANQKNLTIINRISGDVVIKADLYMTELIFRNLLSNAVKFSKFGGFIYFDYASVPGYHQITVADTGIGISEENIKKLMQIDKNYTSKGTGGETGTGLGLILCKEHLDKNGGKIEVVSELGKGSSFIISFPVKNSSIGGNE
ncbi:MAG: PAS domain-containing protein [Ignavibacteria bacterium]|nr:PAS domain-containing protein [Ignavibacteria bacterium]